MEPLTYTAWHVFSALWVGPVLAPGLVCLVPEGDAFTREVNVVKSIAELITSDAHSREININRTRPALPASDAFSREVNVIRPTSPTPVQDVYSRELNVVMVRPQGPPNDVSSREWTVTLDATLFAVPLSFSGLALPLPATMTVAYQSFRVDTGAQLFAGLMQRGPQDRYLFRATPTLVDLRIAPPRPFLRRKVRLNLVNGSVLSLVKIANGDVTGNGEVDLTDLDLTIASYGTTPDDRDHIPGTDVNFDGEVDLTDVDIIIANYGAEDE